MLRLKPLQEQSFHRPKHGLRSMALPSVSTVLIAHRSHWHKLPAHRRSASNLPPLNLAAPMLVQEPSCLLHTNMQTVIPRPRGCHLTHMAQHRSLTHLTQLPRPHWLPNIITPHLRLTATKTHTRMMAGDTNLNDSWKCVLPAAVAGEEVGQEVAADAFARVQPMSTPSALRSGRGIVGRVRLKSARTATTSCHARRGVLFDVEAAVEARHGEDVLRVRMGAR